MILPAMGMVSDIVGTFSRKPLFGYKPMVYSIAGIAGFGFIVSGIYFWFPKMFGKMMNETWGKVHFTLSFIAGNCVFFPMHILGIAGQPRRYADPLNFEWLQPLYGLNQFISICAFILGASQL